MKIMPLSLFGQTVTSFPIHMVYSSWQVMQSPSWSINYCHRLPRIMCCSIRAYHKHVCSMLICSHWHAQFLSHDCSYTSNAQLLLLVWFSSFKHWIHPAGRLLTFMVGTPCHFFTCSTRSNSKGIVGLMDVRILTAVGGFGTATDMMHIDEKEDSKCHGCWIQHEHWCHNSTLHLKS